MGATKLNSGAETNRRRRERLRAANEGDRRVVKDRWSRKTQPYFLFRRGEGDPYDTRMALGTRRETLVALDPTALRR
jgi:hypothetical protein